MKKKTVALLLALVLCAGCAVGGTVAWLTDKTDTVVNTFTYSDINITLDETATANGTTLANSYKMVPGDTITKDPKVTVKAGSEACWLFVKLDKSATYDDYIEQYVVTSDWKKLEDGVYYCQIEALTAEGATDKVIPVLGGGSAKYGETTYTWEANQLLVKPTVTKQMMNEIDGLDDNGVAYSDDVSAKAELDKRPTLSVTAYAIQQAHVADAAAAWAQLQADFN